jgi:hypothetical protein
MNKPRLMRRAAMALIGIAILSAGATAVTAALTTTTNQTSPTPVGEPTGQGSPPLNPCTLVTLSAAQGIVHAIGSATEAPLGPTCIFKRSDAKPSITLTVRLMNFAKATAGLQNSVPVTAGKYSGLCGTRGPQALYLSLGSNQVLNVIAPCGIAKALAAIAASNL